MRGRRGVWVPGGYEVEQHLSDASAGRRERQDDVSTCSYNMKMFYCRAQLSSVPIKSFLGREKRREIPQEMFLCVLTKDSRQA